MARKQDDGLIYAGDVYVRNRRITGAGFVNIGNTTAFKIKSESETKERISKQKDSFGQALNSITSPKPTTCTFELDTFDRHNLAMALMGVDTAVEKAAETVADEAVTVTKQGQWYQLAHDNIDPATVVVKTAADADVDAVAYEVNASLGMILIKDGSTTVTEGSGIKVSYKTIAAKGFKIDAGAVLSYDLEIKIDGENRVNGKKGSLHVPSAVVAADGEIDWFGDDFASASFGGNIVKVGAAAPYTFSEIE